MINLGLIQLEVPRVGRRFVVNRLGQMFEIEPAGATKTEEVLRKLDPTEVIPAEYLIGCKAEPFNPATRDRD